MNSIIGKVVTGVIFVTSFLSYSVEKTELIFSLEEKIHAPLLHEINNLQQGEINATYFAFTSKDIAQALIDAQGRGVDVKVVVDHFGLNKDTVALLREANVPVRIFNFAGKKGSHLHSKSTVIREPNGETTVFLGSANVSVQSAKNSEVITIVRNDEDYYNQNRTFFDAMWQRSADPNALKDEAEAPNLYPIDLNNATEQATLEITPQKLTMIHSGEYNLTESAFARRIKNTNPETEKIDLLLYSFNDPSFKKAVKRFFLKKGRGRLIIDKNSLSSEKDFLDKIVQSGALVYVYNPQKRSKVHSLQHVKALVRHGENPLVVVSENNPTLDARTDWGKAALHPDDVDLAKAMTGKINDLVSHYTDLYVPETSMVKRKLFQEEPDIEKQQSKRLKELKTPQAKLEMIIELERLKKKLESSITKDYNKEVSSTYF